MSGTWSGDKTVALSFDCDFDPDMEAVEPLTRLLMDLSLPASFAIPGYLASRHSAVTSRLIADGFEIVNHTDNHPGDFRSLGHAVQEKEIARAQSRFEEQFGILPKGFRCPHGMRQLNRTLLSLLAQQELLYDSSLVGFGVAKIDEMIEVPVCPCPEHPLTSFDSYHHFRFPGVSASNSKMYDLWTELLEDNELVSVFFDPIDFQSSNRLDLLKRMLEEALRSDFTFRTLAAVAQEAKNT